MRENTARLSFFFLGVIVGVSFWQWQRVSPLTMQVSEQRIQLGNFSAIERARAHQFDATFDYGFYNKRRPVQLIVDAPRGRVSLQILYGRNESMWVGGETQLNYLKTQVEAMVAEKNGIQIQNGMTLRLEGYPIWGPYISSGPDGSTESLLFGDSATFEGNTIIVHGAPNKPVGYYPYTLFEM